MEKVWLPEDGKSAKTTCSLCGERKHCLNNKGKAMAHEDYLCFDCVKATIERYQEYLNSWTAHDSDGR